MSGKLLSLSVVLMVVMLLGPLALVLADSDHIEARRLYEAGAILPLEAILKQVRQTHPGKILEVELEREYGRIVYELEILDQDGVVWELYIDAATGERLLVREDD